MDDNDGGVSDARELWLGIRDGRRKALHQTLIEAQRRWSTRMRGRRATAQASGVLETDRYPRQVLDKTKGSRPKPRPVGARIERGAELR